MTIARRESLRLDITPFYHCMTRCVRRAFLCGRDFETGEYFEHRKTWIEKHLLLLSDVFCIDVAGYAVMSNHYHLVLYVNQKAAAELSDAQVLERWFTIYKGPEFMRRFWNGELISEEESNKVLETLLVWRAELTNISRFIGHLNQTISRRANREDNCRGRFWESRFKLQAILDVRALLRTLCYVDLNPVRSKVATKPETSAFTSVKRRLTQAKSGLMEFGSATSGTLLNRILTDKIPIRFVDYLELLDYTGREIRKGKQGFIEEQEPRILARLNLNQKAWGDGQKAGPSSSWCSRAVGGSDAIERFCQAIGQQWIWAAKSKKT